MTRISVTIDAPTRAEAWDALVDFCAMHPAAEQRNGIQCERLAYYDREAGGVMMLADFTDRPLHLEEVQAA